MSMQLFSFGHPCEHQLHRACIGGSNCPLNGYPDTWCCSFIKGKINFKRDRPCEGPRCHWDFVHPTQSQFDEVTQVLEQSRPIAAKLDEAKDTDLLSFQINNPHIIDTVQCALHMMRHPPSTCARRVGQLLAYAAVLAGEQDVFLQLLKTMKKPVDGYILGAYAYLTQSKSGGEKGGANQKGSKKQSKKKDNKDDITTTLADMMVKLMNAALSLGGQLVDREDQHVLQAMLIKALSTYPKSDKQHQEMLEKAIAKFGHRKLDDEEEAATRRETARPEATAAAAAMPVTEIATTNKANIPGTTATAPTTAATTTTTTAHGGEAPGAPLATEETPVAAAAATAVTQVPSLPPTATTTAAAKPTETPAVAAAAVVEPSNYSTSATGAVAPAMTTPTRPVPEGESKALAPPASSSSERRTSCDTYDATPAAKTPLLAASTTPKTDFSSAPGTPGTATITVSNGGPFNVLPIFGTSANSLPFPQQTLTQTSSVGTTATSALAGTSAVATTGTTTTTALLSAATAHPSSQSSTGPTTANIAAGVTPPPAQPQAQIPVAAATATTTGPLVGISRILPILRKHADRYDKPTLWSVPDREGPVPNMYLCGGQFSVKSQLWGPTPLGEAPQQTRMDKATKKLIKYIESVREMKVRATEEANRPPPPPKSETNYARYYNFEDDSEDSWFSGPERSYSSNEWGD